MSIEETLKWIVESQARSEASTEKANARMDRADARMDRAEKKAERELEAIRKLLRQGMKSLAELAEAQKETDRLLKAFIKSSRNGGSRGNGNTAH